MIPAPVDEAICRETNKGWGNDDEPRRVKDTRTYRDVVRNVEKEIGCVVVDVWRGFMDACG